MTTMTDVTLPLPGQVPSAEQQAAATPEGVLEWLRAGNERVLSSQTATRDLLADAGIGAGGQYPLAAVLGCVDSRVPVEQVFDLGIGDIFVARTAGNVAGPDVLGSFEFATAVAGSKAILVLGHSACGAVKGACDGVELGHLTGLLAKITPAVEAVTGETAPGSDDDSVVAQVVEQNVRNVIAGLTADSEVLADRVESGELLIAGAVVDLATVQVDWLEDAA
ncbi:carbonic anhydrase [Euzebya tangerina]|uniref:carbonic anhydrase n=1 Tax=Euzebya tangerina TaxID=591198 RepID=UPI000E31C6F5|nr:carbonic anhydrase [Euzebya tangerina]